LFADLTKWVLGSETPPSLKALVVTIQIEKQEL